MERLTFEGNFCDISKCVEVGFLSECKADGCSQRQVWERLKHYEDLEEQGWLVVLPCRVGDKIYKIPSKVTRELNIISGHEENNRVYEQTVCRAEVYGGGVYLLITCDGMDSVHSSFYKENWFLTRTEAEAALAASGKVGGE